MNDKGKARIFPFLTRAYNSGLTEKEVTLLPLLTPNSRAEGADGSHKKGITLLYARVGEDHAIPDEMEGNKMGNGKKYGQNARLGDR
jgi:hypothetical protein